MRILRLFRTTIGPAFQALLVLALVLAPVGAGLVWALRASGREQQVADQLKNLPSKLGHGVAETVVDGTGQLVEDLTNRVESLVSDAEDAVRESVLEDGTGPADARTPASPLTAGEQDGMSSEPEVVPAQDDNASSVALSPSDVTITTGGEWATEQESHILDEINRIRQEHGLKPLRWDDTLAEIARSRAAQVFEFQSADGTSLKDDLTETVDLVSEALYFDPIKREVAAASAWIESPDTQTALLADHHKAVGIGVAYSDRPVQVWRAGQSKAYSVVVSAIFRTDYASSVALSSSDVTITTGGEWATEQESHILDEINRIRQEHGLKPLRWDDTLAKVAQSRAAQVFEFQSTDGTSLKDDLREAGIQRAGLVDEALYFDWIKREVTAASVWIESPDTQNALLAHHHKVVGIGVAYSDRPVQVWRAGQSEAYSVVVSAVFQTPDPQYCHRSRLPDCPPDAIIYWYEDEVESAVDDDG